MLRIAHISDLHLEVANLRRKHSSLLQWLAKVLGQALFDTEVNARGYDRDKLQALKNVFQRIKPNLIVVSGDLTNFGDRESLKMAIDTIEELKGAAGADRAICVPGNHDALIERVACLRKSVCPRVLLGVLAKFSKEIDIPARLSRRFSKKLQAEGDLSLLQGYVESIQPQYGTVDPSQPIFVDAGWGEVAFFLFDSTNDPSLMANEGRIGPQQFNQLNKYLLKPENEKRLLRAIRVAVLHHHPISAPRAKRGCGRAVV